MFRLLSNIFYFAFGLLIMYVAYAIIVGDIDLTNQFIVIGKAVANLFA